MGLRPARIYRDFKRPYTRTAIKIKKYQYIKGVPGSKIHVFEMGNQKGDFEKVVSLISNCNVQVRHNALEAGRVSANAYLKKHVDTPNYFMKVRVYPHHILREHAQAAIAQADRYYDGMRKPFGKPTGTAARVKKGQAVISVQINEKNVGVAKEALTRAGKKLAGKFRIEIE